MGIALVTHQLTIAWTEHGIDSLLNLPSNPISPKAKTEVLLQTHTHTTLQKEILYNKKNKIHNYRDQ